MIDGYRSLAHAAGGTGPTATVFPQRPVESWLVALTQTITISAEIANRVPILRIADVYDNTLAVYFGPIVTAGAPTTHLIHWAAGIPDAVELFPAYPPWQSVINIPIPVDLWMPPGYTPVCGIFGAQTNDSSGNASAIYLERQSPDERNNPRTRRP